MIGSGLDLGEVLSALPTDAMAIQSRHSAAGFVPAHRLDHAANLRALVADGCTHVLAVASTGSLRSDWPVGTVVAPDDFFAPWVNPTIFDDRRGHSVPGFDAEWRREVVATWEERTDTPLHDGGVYAQTIGPRFETAAEIRFLTSVADLVGMTVAAECIIARELGLAYAALCFVDNMANGVAGVQLTVAEYEAGAASNRARAVRDLGAVVVGLLDATP
jgi:5'-methylthioadenosine phosphorylase